MVETKVTFGNDGGEVIEFNVSEEGTYSFKNADDEDNYFLELPKLDEANNTTTTNKLKTTKLQVQKKWVGDDDYADITRPTTNNPVRDWEVWFVVQRSADNGTTWNNVKLETLYGSYEETSKRGTEIIGLPQYSASGTEYKYRIRELPPNPDGTYTIDDDNSIVDENQEAVSVIEDEKIFSSGVGWEYTADYT